MSWPIVREVLNVRLTKLTASEKLVLMALARYANPEGKCIYPSVATLATSANLSESQVQKILRKLQSIGYVRVVHRNPGGNFYQTTLRALNLGAIVADGEAARVVKCHKKVNSQERSEEPPPHPSKEPDIAAATDVNE